MFEYVKGNTCFWPVDLPKRQDDGTVVSVPVLIQFTLFTREELKARRTAITDHAKAVAAAGGPDAWGEIARFEISTNQSQEVELRARLVGWKGIVAAGTEEELPFSTEVRDWLLSDEARFDALNRGLYEASRGAVRKN